jgi:hypothetical protein
VRFGELFGMPREVAPQSNREFCAWFEGMLDSDEMDLTPNAQEIGYGHFRMVARTERRRLQRGERTPQVA